MAEKKKLLWLLMLQGWTMLWVVIGHSPLFPDGGVPADCSSLDRLSHGIAELLYTFAYSFHMPLFIMISGYLFFRTRICRPQWNWSATIREKLIRLGIPYLCFITLALIVKICVPGGVERTVELSPGGILTGYIYPYDGPLREMWFVAVILLYFSLFPLYRLILRSQWLVAATLAIGLCGFYWPYRITGFLAMSHAVHNFIFFFVGLLIASRNLEKQITSPVCILTSGVIFILSLIYGIQFGTKLFGSLAFWGLAIMAERRLTDGLFGSFRNYTYQIFLIGIFVQILVKILFRKFDIDGTYPLFYLASVLLGLYVPVAIARIIERTDSKLLKRICGL